MSTTAEQKLLSAEQIERFHVTGFVEDQRSHFELLTSEVTLNPGRTIVDIGGGCGYFARALNRRVRVIDTDLTSLDKCRTLHGDRVEAIFGNALSPEVQGDEEVVCFNLILHHLVADTEAKTLELQKAALLAWKGKVPYVFVNEYAYESLLPGFGGRLIYEITKNKLLSAIAKAVSKIAPSLRANTFGVGVRFRSHGEWLRIFKECGFQVVATKFGEDEHVPAPLRMFLLLTKTNRDSFLLRAS